MDEKCYKKNKTHTHSFTRAKVPKDQGPPDNHDELIAKAYMQCCECAMSLLDINKRVYICVSCSPDPAAGDALYWCKGCKESTEHEHKRSKLKGNSGIPFMPKNDDDEQAKKEYLDQLFDEYHKLDYEDAIGGGEVLTRFKYAGVSKEDFGLSAEEILLLDDQKLNQVVSLKKYRPYRDRAVQKEEVYAAI